MTEQQPKRIILALGLFSPVVGNVIMRRGMNGVIAATRESFPNKEDEIVTIRDLTDFDEQFEWIGSGLEDGKYRGLASGYYVQEALEGSHGISDIQYDLAGIDSVTFQSHAGSELRSLIAHIASFFPRRVHIHFRSENGLATVPKDAEQVEGARLPDWLYARLLLGRNAKTRFGVDGDQQHPEGGADGKASSPES